MGLFSSIFGGGKKVDYSQNIPEPPKFSLAAGSQDQYTQGLQQLIDVFNNRANGNDLFDAIKYIYEPQAQQLRQSYGIDTDPGDIYSQRTGSLPQTLASLNSRGLLDTGTSGIIEGQLRSNLNNQLGQAFGSAKTTQRNDINSALDYLHQLFPERFQAQNIGNQVDYQNAVNSYDALLQRNAATVNQQQQRAANKANAWDSALGLGLGALGGGFSGAGLFGSASQIGSGGASGFGAGFLQNLTGASGGYNPSSMFQPRGSSSPMNFNTGSNDSFYSPFKSSNINNFSNVY